MSNADTSQSITDFVGPFEQPQPLARLEPIPRHQVSTNLPLSLDGHLCVAAERRGLSRDELVREILWEWTVNDMQGDEPSTRNNDKHSISVEYHSVNQIRVLILKYLPDLIDWFGSDDFHLTTFCDYLSRKTTLLPGDYEIIGKRRRWNSQTNNALQAQNWPEFPIHPSGRRGHYRIAPHQIAAHAANTTDNALFTTDSPDSDGFSGKTKTVSLKQTPTASSPMGIDIIKQ
jgi:hypothetical protein